MVVWDFGAINSNDSVEYFQPNASIRKSLLDPTHISARRLQKLSRGYLLISWPRSRRSQVMSHKTFRWVLRHESSYRWCVHPGFFLIWNLKRYLKVTQFERKIICQIFNFGGSKCYFFIFFPGYRYSLQIEAPVSFDTRRVGTLPREDDIGSQ